jgi:hypothetical protein
MLSSQNSNSIPAGYVEAMPLYLQHGKLAGSLLFAVLLSTYAPKRDTVPMRRLDFAVPGVLGHVVRADDCRIGCRLCPFCLIDFLVVDTLLIGIGLVCISHKFINLCINIQLTANKSKV